LLQLVNAQVILEFDLSWHTPSIPPDLILETVWEAKGVGCIL
jgi:hypothetical protein